jgi:hypothetical protein
LGPGFGTRVSATTPERFRRKELTRGASKKNGRARDLWLLPPCEKAQTSRSHSGARPDGRFGRLGVYPRGGRNTLGRNPGESGSDASNESNEETLPGGGKRTALGFTHASVGAESWTTVAPPAARGPIGITATDGISQGREKSASILTSRIARTGEGAILDVPFSSHIGASAFADRALKSATAKQKPKRRQRMAGR